MLEGVCFPWKSVFVFLYIVLYDFHLCVTLNKINYFIGVFLFTSDSLRGTISRKREGILRYIFQNCSFFNAPFLLRLSLQFNVTHFSVSAALFLRGIWMSIVETALAMLSSATEAKMEQSTAYYPVSRIPRNRVCVKAWDM